MELSPTILFQVPSTIWKKKQKANFLFQALLCLQAFIVIVSDDIFSCSQWSLPMSTPSPTLTYYSPWKILSSSKVSAFHWLGMKASTALNKVNIEDRNWWRQKSSRPKFRYQLYHFKTLDTLFIISIPFLICKMGINYNIGF